MGAGFVLDDWYWLRNARLDGAAHTAGQIDGHRPVGVLVWVLLFGVIGPHPAPVFLLLAVANGVSAVLFHQVLQRFFPARVALIAAVLWVVLPLRTALEAWPSAAVAVAAQLFGLAALRLLSAERPGALAVMSAATMMGLGTLSYESVALVAVPAAVAVRWAVSRRIEPRVLGPVVVASCAALGWAVLHIDPAHAGVGWHSPVPVLGANFGWGVAPTRALRANTLSVAVVGSLLLLWWWVREGRRGRPEVAALGVGSAVVLLGALPHLRYFYAPLGAGDRLNYLSAFGGALVWAALLASAWRRRAVFGVAALVGLLGMAGVTRMERSRLWTTAGRDGWRVARAVVAANPAPRRPILVGPVPIMVDNVGAFYDASNVRGAVQFAYGRRVPVDLSYSYAQWESASEADVVRFDQRPLSELDDLDR